MLPVRYNKEQLQQYILSTNSAVNSMTLSEDTLLCSDNFCSTAGRQLLSIFQAMYVLFVESNQNVSTVKLCLSK